MHVLFDRLAIPRATGSEAVRHAQTAIVEALEALGYQVGTQCFITSARRLTAASAFGAGAGWLALVLYPLLVLPLPGWTVAVIGVGGVGILSIVAAGLANGALPSRAPPVEGWNIEAVRGAPRVWLVAHSDSKGQPLSLRGRVVGAGVATGGAIAFAVALAFRVAGPLPWWVAMSVTAVALVGSAALSLSTPRDDSPGAVDNASGVIAALVAAAELGDRTDVGVLVTDAEELGMEGARAWMAGDRVDAVFVNFDGIDARGTYRVMRHGARRTAGIGKVTAELARGIVAALGAHGHAAVVGRLPPGVFVDGGVLAAHGWPGVTVSRGDWHTLGVVHTPRDVAERLDIAAAVEAGRAAAIALSQRRVDGAVPQP